ncbi:MAG: hypothetical protein SO253_01475 [Bacilli bacterium]|nr:hypothetical protein [Bacilli bacterium]
MSKLFSLIKVTLKSSPFFQTSSPKKKNEKENYKKQTIGTIIIFALLFTVVALPFGYISYEMGKVITNLEVNIFKVLIPGSAILIAFTSLPFIVSTLYLQDDTKNLLYLPISSKDIYLSRVVVTILQSYYFVGLFFLPAILGLLIGMNVTIDIYIYGVLFIILSPVLPVIIFGLFFALISKVFNLRAHKTALSIITMFFPLIIMIGFQLISQNIDTSTIDPNDVVAYLTTLVNNTGDILSIIMFAYIPSILSLSASSYLLRLVYMLLSIIVIIGLAILISLVSSKLYYRSLLQDEGVKRSKKKVNVKDYKSSSSLKSLFKAEVKEINRSPVYFFNLVFPTILVPLILLISFGYGFISNGGGNIENIILQLKTLVTFKDPIIVAIALGVVLFLTSTTLTSVTAISRMGTNAYFVKMIPVKPITIIISKILYGVILSLFLAVIVIVGLTVTSIVSIFDAIFFLISLVSLIVFFNFFGIYLDLRKPRLEWLNETQVAKNSITSFIYLLIVWGAILVLVGLVFALNALNTVLPFGYYGYILLLIILILSLVGNYLFYRYFNRSCNEVFKTF